MFNFEDICDIEISIGDNDVGLQARYTEGSIKRYKTRKFIILKPL